MLAFTRKENSSATAFMIAGAAWFVVGTLYGGLTSMHFIAPEVFNNIPALVFGRIRPIHVNTVLFGFATTTLIGCGLYFTPALLRTKLWSQKLGWASWVFWNAAIVSGPITLSLGISQGREYCEYVWLADVSLVLSVLLMVVNLVMTIARRTEKTLYTSVWYYTATFLWTAGFYPIGNVMWHPSTGAAAGLVDSLYLWFYGHNLPGLLLTPLAVGAALFVIPRVARTPLYSHVLSLIGFWGLVTLYSHIGGHHLLQAPIPTWLKTISVIDSLAMVIPVYANIANIWLTARGQGGRVLQDPAGRFIMAGLIWYLIVCTQGPIQSLPFLQRVTHFNNWVIGHSHIAVLGFAGYIALGAMWHILPLSCGRRVYSQRLINLQFGMLTVGLTGFFLVLTIAGLVQGHAWNNGETVYRVLPELPPYFILRAAFGMSIFASAILGLVNVILTLRRGEPFQPVEAAPQERAP